MAKQRGRKSKESLESSAKCDYNDIFQPIDVTYHIKDNVIEARFDRHSHNTRFTLAKREEGIIRKFPVIFRGDGTPWDLGNLYLIHKFSEAAKQFDMPPIETIQSAANHLTAYLRWIEHSQKKNSNTRIDIFHLPKDQFDRVTYRYKRYLLKAIKNRTISPSTASVRVSAVVAFYRALLENPELISSNGIQELDNEPFQKRLVKIGYKNAEGLEKLKTVATTDLTIKVPKRDHLDAIVDGGRNLHPLSKDEQKAVSHALYRMDSRIFQLMCWVALFTGARMQTVCTLRVKHIVQLMESEPVNGYVYLFVGQGTDVDVKYQDHKNKRYKVQFPYWLILLLFDYSLSEEASSRRGKSFYGNGPDGDNYLFLNKDGGTYYTSKRELNDRQSVKYSQRIHGRNRVDFPITKGQAVRNFVTKLKENIRAYEPDLNLQEFSFHDFRATFGINYVNCELSNGVKPDIIVEHLKTLMGHMSVETTYRYLNYLNNNIKVRRISEAVASNLREMFSQEDQEIARMKRDSKDDSENSESLLRNR